MANLLEIARPSIRVGPDERLQKSFIIIEEQTL